MHADALDIPPSGESFGKHCVVQLAVAVRSRSCAAFERGVATEVTVTAHEENPRLRLVHEACQDVRRESVDREHSRDSIRSYLFRTCGAVPDACILDDGIECAGLVRVFGELLRLAYGGQVPDEDSFSLRESLAGLLCPLCISSVKSDLVTSFAKGFGGCKANSVAGSSDEDAYHFGVIMIC